jgi:hypothetical protein
MKYEIIKNYKPERFRQVTGVLPATFNVMVKVLKETYTDLHQKKHGRHRKLSIEDMLLATLEYYKEYRAYECIAASFDISKQNICKTIHWVEEVLIQSGVFSLPKRKVLRTEEPEFEVILVDSTETPIERPKKGQKKYYSGKKNDIQ